MPLFLVLLVLTLIPNQQTPGITKISGVNRGKTLFIQNTYNSHLNQFCIEELFVNDRKIVINKTSSAIKLDFKDFDAFVPVFIKIIHRDSCAPIILNPDAIAFHSIFSFTEISLTDSTLTWITKGEHSGTTYSVEKIQNGLWSEEELIPAKGAFEGATYTVFPILETGPNKYRIKYQFPDEQYLYSREIDLHYYPEPVTFRPQKTTRWIYLSRTSPYKVYDPTGKMVLEGTAKEIDVRLLYNGDYVIYFDGKYPGVFTKE